MKSFFFTIAAAMFVFTNANAENMNATEVSGGTKINDTSVVRPASVTADAAQIVEDLKIIDAAVEPAAPLLPGKSFEEIIADDNLVIESNGCKEVYPLDFKKINAVEKKTQKRPIKKTGERFVSCL